MGKIRRIKKDTAVIREGLRDFYFNKYYSLYLGHYQCDSITEEQRRFILSQFWCEGKIACFVLEESKTSESLKALMNQSKILKQEDENLLVFTPFATTTFNLNNSPSVATLIALRGSSFIPKGNKINNKDIVIGWGHSSHRAISKLIMPLIDRVVEVEMTINTCLFNNKIPRLIQVDSEDKEKMRDLVQAVENDENVLFVDSLSAEAMKNVLNSGEYNIDKLYTYKTQLENEILTILGIDNIQNEKKERMLVDEVSSNNDLISYNAHLYLDTLNDWGKRVEKAFGISLKWKIDAVAEEISVEGLENESNENNQENEEDDPNE